MFNMVSLTESGSFSSIKKLKIHMPSINLVYNLLSQLCSLPTWLVVCAGDIQGEQGMSVM